MSLAADTAASTDHNPISDVEAQMRRALGLYGGMRPRLDNDRSDQSVRAMDRFGQQSVNLGGSQGLHRRRFVQDGEIPVTVVRRDPAGENANSPQSSRLQRTEAALAAETAARERAERALHDAQAQISALQTKIGHADLATNEAVDIARREREAAATLREFSEGFEEQMQTMRDRVEAAEQSKRYAQVALAEERAARKVTDRTIRELTERAERAERALETAEHDNSGQDEPMPMRTATVGNARPMEPHVPARRGRPPGAKSFSKPVAQPALDAEPVKWWLMPAGKTKVR